MCKYTCETGTHTEHAGTASDNNANWCNVQPVRSITVERVASKKTFDTTSAVVKAQSSLKYWKQTQQLTTCKEACSCKYANSQTVTLSNVKDWFEPSVCTNIKKQNKMKNYKEQNTATLLQWYANARRTAGCGGHFKGQMNDDYYFNYATELRNRGIDVPRSIGDCIEINVEIPEGIFNGEGSF